MSGHIRDKHEPLCCLQESPQWDPTSELESSWPRCALPGAAHLALCTQGLTHSHLPRLGQFRCRSHSVFLPFQGRPCRGGTGVGMGHRKAVPICRAQAVGP